MNIQDNYNMRREIIEEDDRLYIYIRNGIAHYTPSSAYAFTRKDESTDILVAEKE